MDMAEVDLRKLRTIVHQCLKEHKLKNDIRLKKVGFDRGFLRVVIIKNWNPVLDGHKWSSLVRMIGERTRKFYAELSGWALFVEAE